jgi:hypothetical protein
MAKVIVALALALVCAQDKPGQPGEGGPNQELDQALTKAGQMDNYTANIAIRKEGATEPGKDLGMQPIEVRVMPGQPIHVKSGELEGYRKGDTFIVNEGGAWKKVEGDMAGHKLAMIRAPHELFRTLKSASFKGVRREDSEGGRVFSGDLTDAALRQILAGKKGADAGPATGSAKVWLGRDGFVSKCEFVIEHKAAGDKAAGGETRRVTKTVEFRDVGSTKYEIPADADKQFGGTGDKPMDDPKK